LLDKSLTAALALSVVGALGTFLFVLGRPEVGERFTEFYLLQSTGRAKVYPAEIPANWPIPLIVGVVNREHDDVQYRVEMQVSGQEPEQIADIRLAQDEKWEKRVTFSLAEPGEDQKVSFHLYKELEEEPYRSLHLWIDVLPSGAPIRAETPPPAAPPTPDISQTAEVSPSPAPAPQATPPPSPSASPTGGPTSTPVGRTVHIVQPGETLSSIARLYGVAYEAIMYANGLEDPNLIEVGQELTIPHLDEILPTLTLTPAQE
nr:DUF1616 domain-containing protein [Anaerolineae bacterium]NIN93902.1 DUF1616 domain-containing protein [Anaerolineae bacterium]NIQ76935.1 DUF1616 domain-containing protein [Anaerolineae bacterium]